MKNIVQSIRLRAVAIILLIGSIGTVAVNMSSAHQGAKGIVKERMDLMSEVAKQMKLILQTVQGKKPFDSKAVSEAASTIAKHASQMPKLFPEGSGGHPSEATDNVWKQWDKFLESSKDMQSAANALSTKSNSAKSRTDIVPEFKQLAASCSSCHSKFRVKK